ncbi:MAG TPA: prepilin-type N-terminal cleavage/methylation domain-containing protein, partial [Arenimonas sp.]|nr:prepilin-type N-terminal cleavage/methylation domain-containing protein [Arenimonas sp.]
MSSNNRYRQRGVTLVELVIAMVIVSVAVGGITLAFMQTVRSSADPMIDAQALAIAEAYMDEILAKPQFDSTGSPGCTAGVPRTNCAEVGDYHGIANQKPTNQFGEEINELDAYAVTVAVGGAELGIGDSTVV